MIKHGILEEDGTIRLVSFEDFILDCVERDGLTTVLKRTDITHGRFVSTIFLGHNYLGGAGEDTWFETMAFGPNMRPLHQSHYTTQADALSDHDRIVRELQEKEFGAEE